MKKTLLILALFAGIFTDISAQLLINKQIEIRGFVYDSLTVRISTGLTHYEIHNYNDTVWADLSILTFPSLESALQDDSNVLLVDRLTYNFTGILPSCESVRDAIILYLKEKYSLQNNDIIDLGFCTE